MSPVKPPRTALLPRLLLVIAAVNVRIGHSFQVPVTGAGARPTTTRRVRSLGQGPMATAAAPSRRRTFLCLASSAIEVRTLEKPLGLILEEVVENEPQGVYVREVSESGSAFPHRSNIEGRAVRSVQGQDVSRLRFEQVMDVIAQAPSPLNIEFAPLSKEADAGLSIGTPVTLTVLLHGKNGEGPSVTVKAKVGDNLRKALLDNGVEVYTGFQNVGNCGGAGQCGLCAFDFVTEDGSGTEGWLDRSDYENKKLRKYPLARLTCLNSIQGPATIRKTKQ